MHCALPFRYDVDNPLFSRADDAVDIAIAPLSPDAPLLRFDDADVFPRAMRHC